MGFFKTTYDFLGIGDIVADDFIRIDEAEILPAGHDQGNLRLCLSFADKVPYKESYLVPAVGNSPNAAVAANRLGLKSAILTNIGDDYHGKLCLGALKKEGVSTEFVAVNKKKKTNYHYVLWVKDDRTILIRHEEFDYKLCDFNEPKWVYLSSLGGNSLSFHEELEKYFNEHPKIKLAFQPGTFQIKLGRDVLAGIYRRADVFFCNKEESQRILETNEPEIKNLLKKIAELGPKIVVITDGVKGAYSYDGKETLFMREYPDPAPPFERTGAGDAFSSTFAVALALGKSVREAMMWAPINPMSVVQKIGAQAGLLTRPELKEFLKKAPADYIPKVLG